MNQFFAIGTSHKQASVALREQVAFAEDELAQTLARLRDRFAEEAALLSTCNRTELYLVPKEGVAPEDVLQWLGNDRGVEVETGQFFTLHSHSAARHLMEVAAGVDSQVIGDIQIIGQVKDAYRNAQGAGSLGPILTRLFETALRAGKRVKTETELFTGAVSISYVAVELARKIFYPLEDQRTLVVGAGSTGELTAISLRGRGVKNISVANRTEGRGRELIDRLGFGTLVKWDDLGSELHNFDIIIVATGSREYILDFETVRQAAAKYTGNQMLIVDLAVPRNVDPRVSEIPKVFCKDLNDLNSVIEANVERRREEIPKAEGIITEELDEFDAWHRMAPIRPVIADLSRRAESIAREMLEENRGRFTEKDFNNVEKLVGSVVRKIIALPMSRLLDAGDDIEGALRRAEHVRELFDLNRKKEDEE